MNIKIAVISTLFVVLLFGGIHTDARRAERVRGTIDIRTPIDTLKAAYANFTEHIDILKLLILIVDVVFKCILPSMATPAASSLLNADTFYRQLNHSQLQLLAERLSHFNNIPALPFQDIPEGFCDTAGFKQIHNFIWVEDQQLEDLVHFFGKFGYPEIYQVLQAIYTSADCSDELKAELPRGPPTNNARKQYNTNALSKSINVREQILQSRNSVKQEEDACDILDIIGKIPETGLIQLLQLIETIMYEFSTNYNLHFLIGKIQEPNKGWSVNKFRDLEAVKAILKQMHEKLLESPVWSEIIEVIKDITGVDYRVLNPYNFIFSLFEFLVWGTPFPADPKIFMRN